MSLVSPEDVIRQVASFAGCQRLIAVAKLAAEAIVNIEAFAAVRWPT